MCCWMGSHFHDWIDYNGVAYSIELLEWAHIFSDFGVRKFFTFTVSKHTRMFVLLVKSKVFFIQFKKFVNSLYDDQFKRFISKTVIYTNRQ